MNDAIVERICDRSYFERDRVELAHAGR